MAFLIPVVAAAGLAACGSSSSNNDPSKPAAMLNFAHCMRANGVPNFPDPGGNGSGGIQIAVNQRAGSGASMTVNGVAVSGPAFQRAMNTCRSKLPNGGHPPPLSAKQRAEMLQFSQCMRAHGLTNFPDPSFSSSGPRIRFGGAGLNPNSPAFQQAQAACAKYRPGGFAVKAP